MSPGGPRHWVGPRPPSHVQHQVVGAGLDVDPLTADVLPHPGPGPGVLTLLVVGGGVALEGGGGG